MQSWVQSAWILRSYIPPFLKPQRNHGVPFASAYHPAPVTGSQEMAKLPGLTSRTSKARVLGPPRRTTTKLLLRSPPGIAVDKTGQCIDTLTLVQSYYPLPGRIGHHYQHYCHYYHYYHHQYHQYHHCHYQYHHSSQHISEPCPSHSGPFSSSPRARKWEPSAAPTSHISLPAATGQPSAVNPSPSSLSSSLPLTAGVFLRRPRRPMAYNTYSTASSAISTPRSTSPSSVFSGRSSHTFVASKRLSLSLQRRQSAFNPLYSVDVVSIEQRMKMASLDGLRGYAQDHYGEVIQQRTTDYVPQSVAGGYQVLREPLWNKGVHLRSPRFQKLPTKLYMPMHPVQPIDFSFLKVFLLLPRSVCRRTSLV